MDYGHFRAHRHCGWRGATISAVQLSTKKCVAIGLSGGVDSAVSAHLLLEKGYDVVGVFLRTWSQRDPNCPQTEDEKDARSVAGKLGIPLHSFDLTGEYREDVFTHFLAELEAGRTPNPDILCNTKVKFGAALKLLPKLNCSHFATGHYAALVHENRLFSLQKPADKNKDQTYFLHELNQDQLAKAMFPLAKMTKPEVRKIATKQGFSVAEKKDSVGICMVGDRDFPQFIADYISPKPGELHEWGTEIMLGNHIGTHFYTLGQRRGHGIGGVKNRPEAPWFVVAKDEEARVVYLSQDESMLNKSSVVVKAMHWSAGVPPAASFTATAKVRYRTQDAPCTVTVSGPKTTVQFNTPERAPTPGQSLVLYSGNTLLGGGVISQTY